MQKNNGQAEKCKEYRQAKEWWNTLKSKHRGHFQYYGVSGNYKSIKTFYKHTVKMFHK